MDNRYKKRFEQLNIQNRKAVIPYSMLGFPNSQQSYEIIRQMIKSGVSALELGFAFSDPVADGPIIQNASYKTIASNFSVVNAFDLIADVRKIDEDIPIGVLVYFNTVLSQGIDKFFKKAKECGVDGVLIADLPPENSMEVQPAALKHGIDLIFLLSPLTATNRIKTILAHAGGFLYLVSRLGVTGITERNAIDDLSLTSLVKTVQEQTTLPICAGFGISNPNDVQAMLNIGVDGIITGSRLIEIVQNDNREMLEQLDEFFNDMLAVCAGHRTLPLLK